MISLKRLFPLNVKLTVDKPNLSAWSAYDYAVLIVVCALIAVIVHIAMMIAKDKKMRREESRKQQEAEELRQREETLRLIQQRVKQEFEEAADLYRGWTYRSLCLIPDDSYVSSDGLPCEVGHQGNGDWGRKYSRVVNMSTHRMHYPDCQYACGGKQVNVFDCIYRSTYSNLVVCPYCKSDIDSESLEWFDRYMVHRLRCLRYKIDMKFEEDYSKRVYINLRHQD